MKIKLLFSVGILSSMLALSFKTYVSMEESIGKQKVENIKIMESAEYRKSMEMQDVEEDLFAPQYDISDYSFSDVETEELAHIAMAEAEGQSIACKMLVIWTVLNRVNSEEFPDTVHEVIFQHNESTGVYQFSCIGNGRYDSVKPNEECYEAVDMVNMSEDISEGCLYFELCDNEDNWHSKNLDFLFECDSVRFYR